MNKKWMISIVSVMLCLLVVMTCCFYYLNRREFEANLLALEEQTEKEYAEAEKALASAEAAKVEEAAKAEEDDRALLEALEEKEGRFEELKAEFLGNLEQPGEYLEGLELADNYRKQAILLNQKFSPLTQFEGIDFESYYDMLSAIELEKGNMTNSAIQKIGDALGIGIITGFFTGSQIDENNSYYDRMLEVNAYMSNLLRQLDLDYRIAAERLRCRLTGYEGSLTKEREQSGRITTALLMEKNIGENMTEEAESDAGECVRILERTYAILYAAEKIYTGMLAESEDNTKYLNSLIRTRYDIYDVLEKLKAPEIGALEFGSNTQPYQDMWGIYEEFGQYLLHAQEEHGDIIYDINGFPLAYGDTLIFDGWVDVSGQMSYQEVKALFEALQVYYEDPVRGQELLDEFRSGKQNGQGEKSDEQ